MSRLTHQGAMPRARKRRAAKTMLGIAVAGATLATVPAVASAASTVSISGTFNTTLNVNAGSGEANSYLIRKVSTKVVVYEAKGNALTGTGTCVNTSTNRVECPGGSISYVNVNSGDLDDIIDVNVSGTSEAVLDGGSGDDTLKATSSSIFDTFVGGSGRDTVSFAGVSYDVNANLNGLYDDTYGVVDWIKSDVEGIIGGNGNDTLEGAPSGVSAMSFLTGGPGNDTLLSAGGHTNLEGEDGNDTLTGGAGIDWIYGGAGSDAIDGKGDDDILDANDGAGGDTIKCGLGNDYVPFNLGDTILDSPNCETTVLF